MAWPDREGVQCTPYMLLAQSGKCRGPGAAPLVVGLLSAFYRSSSYPGWIVTDSATEVTEYTEKTTDVPLSSVASGFSVANHGSQRQAAVLLAIHSHDLSRDNLVEPFDDLGQFLLGCSANKLSNPLYGQGSDLADLDP
jgi:hypothetical protein